MFRTNIWFIKKTFPLLFLISFFLSNVGYGTGWCAAVNAPPLTSDLLEKAMGRAAQYLVKQVREDGSFVYRVNMNPGVSVPEKYNFLRHAGSIYSMAQYLEVKQDQKVLAAIEQAGGYFQRVTLGPVPGEKSLMAVWSDPKINHTDAPVQAKLGGVGLGLVALLSIEKLHPGFTPLETLRKLGKFILFLQKKDGSFHSKYIPSKGGFYTNWTSLYYPGEAALGLVLLYEKDPSDVWLQGAIDVLEYLSRLRKGQSDIPADHWALLATERLLSFEKNRKFSVPRDLLIQHAVQICESILADQIVSMEFPKRYGGFVADGRTTPTATRLEGLLATLQFLPEKYSDMRARIEVAVERGISFLIRSQIKEGVYSGAIPRAVEMMPQGFPRMRYFNRRAQEIRIDYVQHALSAMIRFYKLKK